jgi:hypothetical protein
MPFSLLVSFARSAAFVPVAAAYLFLVRRMLATRCLIIIVMASVLVSCNTYHVHGAMTYGRIREISPAEIESAIVAYHRTHPDAPVGQIQVVSRSELRIYGSDSACCYSTIERKGPRWEFAGDQVLWTE